MTKLTELLERVKAATGPDRELDGRIAKATGLQFGFCGDGEGSWRCGCAVGDCGAPMGLIDERKCYPSDWRDDDRLPAYTGSIGAAVALVDRVLSGRDEGPLLYARVGYWNAEASNGRNFLQTFHVAIGTPPKMVTVEADGSAEALAILTATLSALIAQGDAQ